jgi:hypothetical protein
MFAHRLAKPKYVHTWAPSSWPQQTKVPNQMRFGFSPIVGRRFSETLPTMVQILVLTFFWIFSGFTAVMR